MKGTIKNCSLAALAKQRLQAARANGECAEVQRLEAEWREALVQGDRPRAHAVGDRLQILRPMPPLTPERRDALVAKLERFLAEEDAAEQGAA